VTAVQCSVTDTLLFHALWYRWDAALHQSCRVDPKCTRNPSATATRFTPVICCPFTLTPTPPVVVSILVPPPQANVSGWSLFADVRFYLVVVAFCLVGSSSLLFNNTVQLFYRTGCTVRPVMAVVGLFERPGALCCCLRWVVRPPQYSCDKDTSRTTTPPLTSTARATRTLNIASTPTPTPSTITPPNYSHPHSLCTHLSQLLPLQRSLLLQVGSQAESLGHFGIRNQLVILFSVGNMLGRILLGVHPTVPQCSTVCPQY
jgi:hypothetical protein